ncbi:MAG: alpha-amylase family glycosyl hydrolase [Chloroflexota bacterium]|nr:alpha-amylase family glycosyl hydrolase [Chloroflexota bacterium]
MHDEARRPLRWWEGAVIYQVYPRSFRDANRDGIGDLAGIVERLDHLRGAPGALGVDAIWLSPIFPSPLHDFGYDISDYTGVAAEFGTLEDLDALVAAAHRRGLRVLLDLVPCHTSVEHPWFVESRSSKHNARRDWFTWQDPAPDGGPPNNWVANFGGSSWTWDPATGQYYLHSFYPEQPDLNWRNPAVADAIQDAMRFWLERGIDGFRVDAIAHAIKDTHIRDNPPAGPHRTIFGEDPSGQERLWNVNRPEVHDVVRGLRRVADAYPDRLLVGEVYGPVENLAGYLGRGAGDEFQLAFDFELLLAPWQIADFRLAIERAEALHPEGTWPTYALSNHDNPRHATRYGAERAALAAFILLTLRGVAVLYAGEEIGMTDATALPGRPHDRAGRDAQRTPMQWTAEPGGGFSSGQPWLPLTDPQRVNVADQQADPSSLLSLYRSLIALRRDRPAVRAGLHRSLFGVGEQVLAWTRELDGDRVLVVANMGSRTERLRLPGLGDRGEVLLATGGRRGGVQLADLRLAPLEGLVIQL